MINNLSIKNFAIIDKVNIEFNSGLTVITGETGSGKSILLEALKTSLGGKADKIMVRNGQSRSVIVTTFNEPFQVRRIITSEGRTKAYINDEPINIKSLKELDSIKVDFHGQHDQQHILNKDTHIEYLDYFCNHADLILDIEKLFNEIQDLNRQLIELKQSKQEKLDRLELLKFQANEIDSVNPKNGEDVEVEKYYKKLNHLDEIQITLNKLQSELLTEDHCVTNILEDKSRELESIMKYDDELIQINELIKGAIIQLQEASSEINNQLDRIDTDPDELKNVQERYYSLQEIKRKYGGSIDAVIEYQNNIQKEIALIYDPIKLEQDLLDEINKKEKLFSKLALKINSNRKRMGIQLSKKIKSIMAELNMPESDFEIRIDQQFSDNGSVKYNQKLVMPNRRGIDLVEFFLSANPGEPLKPLAAIASGGEISRIMLAIKTVFQKMDPINTLVFDEIDSGISGSSAEKVGELLLKLSKTKQVFCITHLSQIARKANHHLNIQKLIKDNQTFVKVNYLTKDESYNLIQEQFLGIEG